MKEDWENDIALAKAVGIDGFALNFAGDLYTEYQMNLAYDAAEKLGDFGLFLSIDYEANHYNPQFVQFTDPAVVTQWITRYKDRKAQVKVNGQALVSTFEGAKSAGDWKGIKQDTTCFFVPVWTSAKGSPDTFTNADGAMGWDVWPYGPTGISTMVDDDWKKLLGSRPYMMGVAPWFYTNLPDAGKNWLWRGDNLWHDRWQQVIEVQPNFVEVGLT